MAATKTATIKIGSYTKPVTKANHDKASVIADAKATAEAKNLIILVKRDYAGRWQAWAKRRNPRGEHVAPHEYEDIPGHDRRARKIDMRHDGGIVYVADTRAGRGEVEAEIVIA